MPIYDYRCDHCGHAFSAVQSFKDDPLETCPNCGKRPRRLLVAPAVVFKGSGWYKTDSRPAPKGEGDGAKADAKAEKAGPPAPDTKTAPSGSGPGGSGDAAGAKSEAAS